MIEPKTTDTIQISDTVFTFPWNSFKQKIIISSPSSYGRIRNIEASGAPEWISIPTEIIDDGRMCKAIVTLSVAFNDLNSPRNTRFDISAVNDKGKATFSIEVSQIGESGASLYFNDGMLLAGSKEQNYSLSISSAGTLRIDSATSSNFSMGTVNYDASQNKLNIKTKTLHYDFVPQRIFFAVVNYTCTTTNRKYQLNIPIVQSTVRRRPIWSDENLSITSGDNYYDIKIDILNNRMVFDTVYEGRIYRFPEQDTVFFNPNRIMENYIQRKLDFSVIPEIMIDKNYGVIANITVNGKVFGTYSFFYDWSYEKKNYFGISDAKPLTVPIKKDSPVDLRQTYVSTLGISLGDDWSYYSLKWSDGSVDEWDEIIWNDCTPTSLRGTNPAAQDRIIRPSDYPGIKMIQIDRGVVLDVKKTCADYAIHYLNKFGGLDSILVNGNVDMDDQIHPHSILKKPIHSGDFEETRYLIENRRKYTVNINWLTKDECSRMDQLLESPQVWFEDLNTNEMVPVVLQNQEMTFHKNKKVRNYKLVYLTSETRRRK